MMVLTGSRFSGGAPTRQQGFVVLGGVLLGMALVSLLATQWIAVKARESREGLIRQAGSDAAQVQAALRQWLTQNAPSIPAGVTTYTTLDFLRAPTCGGPGSNPPTGFLPCAVANYAPGTPQASTTPFGPDVRYQVRIEKNGTVVDARAHYSLNNSEWVRVYNEDISAGLAAAKVVNHAQQASGNIQDPTVGVFQAIMHNVPIMATNQGATSALTNPASPDYGRVVVQATNAPSNDAWLRTDGSNQMYADLNMGGYNLINGNNLYAQSMRLERDANIRGNLKVNGSTETTDLNVLNDTRTRGLTADTARVKGLTIEQNGRLESVGADLSDAVYFMTVLSGATTYSVSKPTCPSGKSPLIYAALQDTGMAQEAIRNSRVDVTNAGSAWTVRPYLEEIRYSLSSTSGAYGFTSITLNKTPTQGNAASLRVVVTVKCG